MPPRLFAASQVGLFFLVRDAGWQRVDVPRSRWLPSVVAVAFDPTDALVVWAGTNRGTFRSDDGGVGLFPASTSGYIRAVATAGRLVLAANGYGILRSDDGGVTWDVALPLWLEPAEPDDP